MVGLYWGLCCLTQYIDGETVRQLFMATPSNQISHDGVVCVCGRFHRLQVELFESRSGRFIYLFFFHVVHFVCKFSQNDQLYFVVFSLRRFMNTLYNQKEIRFAIYHKKTLHFYSDHGIGKVFTGHG